MLSENVTDPNFTPSFEERVLLIPCLFLWIFAPLNVYYIKKSKLRCSCYERTVLKLPWLCLWILSPLDLYYIKKSRSNCQCLNWMNWLKLVTLDILVACCVLEVGGIAMRYKLMQLFDSVIDVFSPFLQLITFVLVYYLVDQNTRKGLRSSGVIFLFWLLDVILGVPHFWALLCHKSQSGFLLVHCVKHLCMIISLILNFFAEPGYTLNQPLNEDKRCPEKMSSFPSRMMFTWVSPLIQKGLRNTLKFSDLWILDPENTLTSSYYKFYKQWSRGIKSSSVCEYSVFWPLVQAFGPTFLFAAFLRLLYDVLVFLEPYLIMELFAYINHGQVVWKGFFYIGLLLSNCIVKNIVQQQKDYRIRLVDMRVQSALYSAIYKKTLKISQLFHQTKLAGGVVNLLTNDVQQLITFIFYFNNAWSAPLQITIAFIILWHILGMAMVAGVVALVVAVTISLCTSYVIKIFQSKHLMMKDHRLKLMHEVLLCMKAIKLNAWESSFEEKFNKIQKRETTYLKKLHFFRTASNLIWNACNFVVPFCSYYWYVKFEGRELDTETALKAYLYFMLLPAPLYFLPNVIVEYSESGASLERINNFLNANEMTGDQVQHDDSESDSIVIENGTFSWGRSVEAVLHNVTLRVKPGSLVAVVGSMGSGKSSLLSATLGEMETISGHINVKGSVAYVPQQAWIQNTTVKDNILFGNKYREDWYRSVVTACALDPDIRLLPAHHHTKIGDQGMNLSGGQKQRISLARAVYMLLDLYLLDDILSSFDAVVGRQIFEHVIGPQGLLKEKTRIFITHSLTHLRNVDTIVYLKDGSIAETPGTYDQLMSREGPFFKFVSINDKQQTTVDDLMPVLENQGDLMEQKTETNPYTSCTEEPKDSNRKPEKVCLLESEENTEIGRVKLSVYLNYLKSSCSLILFCVFLLVTHHWLIFSGLQLIDCWGGQHMYVTFHDNGSCTVDSLFFDRCIGDLDERCTTSLIINVTNSINEDESPSYSSLDKLIGFTNSSNEDIFPSDSRMRSSHIFPNGSNDDKSLSDWNLSILTVFSAAGLLSAMLMFIVEFLVIRNLLNASLRIHKEMLRGVLFAPLSFLNSSPVGQVITRFSHDINILDYSLPREFCMFLFCVTGIIFILTSMMYTVKGLAYFLVPVFVIYILLLLYYLATNRQLKRHEVLCHSSLNSLLSESYQGTSTIRAFKVQERFEKKFDTRVDLLLVFWYHFTVVTMWLNVWLESLGITVLILTSLYGVINRSAVLMGEERRRFDSILLLFATSMINCFMNSVRAAGKIETNIVSVERTKEYRDLQPEEGNKDKRNCSKSEEKKPTDWPSRGKLEVRHLSVRYRENQAFILKDIDFSVEPGQKIGIVGRTGAGKSTLALALFGVIKPENGRGHIIIDDIDIASLPLKKLRSSLSIIPQDPVLFTGTLRMNLDPTETKTDPEIKEALRKVEALQEFVFHHGLDFAITDAGANLSVGQKQVICLVRALLHKSKLLIMDEATASVDLKMDQLIHKTIREEFRDSTVLIIAHRLNTVLESDKVMVIVNGQIQEFDTPNNLLNDNNSFFHTMAQNANLIGNGNVNGD